jgi:TolB-like protein/Tfp pilus assembly protein PilF
LPFFNELKRRNVFRVAVAYIIVGWLLLQVSDTLVPALHLPQWFQSGVALLLILGLPIALIFAWAFEMTPDGLKREHKVDRSQSITHDTGRKLDFAIFGVLVLALGYFAYDKFVLSTERDADLVESTMRAVTEQAAADPEESAVPDKSIAVLPFVNMSSDAEQEYFSDGLSEELLNLLTKIPQLRVTSRSSAFSYKGKDFKIADVGRELNVRYVLEGSVRKAGKQLRITAQLIETGSDTHLWSETYDRTLDNIFAIQDEIASKVVRQLKVTMLGAAPVVEETRPEAYALYLQARQLRRTRNEGLIEQAKRLLQQALEIDPGYAAAWIELSNVYAYQANMGLIPIEEGRALAREAVDKALAIDPEYAPALTNLSFFAWAYDNNLDTAARYLQRALQLEPANTDIISYAADLTRSLGRLDEAIALGEYIVARDPVNAGAHGSLGQYYTIAERWDESIAAYRTALRLSPGISGAQYAIGMALLLKDEPQAALEAMQLEESTWRLIGLPLAYHALGHADESDAALAALIEQNEQGAAYNIAYILAFRGEADRAFEWLDKAVEYKDSGLAVILNEVLFSNIFDDPRWLPFLESIGKSPEQLAAIEFKVTLPQAARIRGPSK